jgi:nitrite reductase/ring-hydroxylating ferredoxin subunit
LRAIACDLLGDDDWNPVDRPELADAIARCPRGQVMAAQHQGHDVAVGRLEDGSVFAMPDRCPHDGGLLSDGFVEAGRLVCGRHGWEFDPATGARVGPPFPSRR